jgi:hypothetical protein
LEGISLGEVADWIEGAGVDGDNMLAAGADEDGREAFLMRRLFQGKGNPTHGRSKSWKG